MQAVLLHTKRGSRWHSSEILPTEKRPKGLKSWMTPKANLIKVWWPALLAFSSHCLLQAQIICGLPSKQPNITSRAGGDSRQRVLGPPHLPNSISPACAPVSTQPTNPPQLPAHTSFPTTLLVCKPSYHPYSNHTHCMHGLPLAVLGLCVSESMGGGSTDKGRMHSWGPKERLWHGLSWIPWGHNGEFDYPHYWWYFDVWL